jgi:polyisoprenyl-phosphate glycosyltransferase
VPQGFTTIILVILFFGGVQLITVRILGEYIQRIYDESRKRPLFIVRNMYGFNEKETDQ